MQVHNLQRVRDALKTWLLTRLLMIGSWLVGLSGRELLPVGCRPIPTGYCDFDPALADYFKGKGMRNGKPITLAMDYSLVARWNHSNKKRGKDERTYGSDYAYAERWGAEVSRQTWGRHMGELEAVGLVKVTTINNQPAYQALPYRIASGSLTFMENSHGQSNAVHEPKPISHEPKQDFHGHLNIESSESLALESPALKTSSTPARDADVDEITKPNRQEFLDRSKPAIPEGRDLSADCDGEDELLVETPAKHPHPNPPVPPPPLAPLTDDECSDVDEIKAFFTGFDDAAAKALIARFGLDRIYAAIAEAVGNTSVRHPPGFVLDQLERGTGGHWRVPRGIDSKSSEQDGRRYVSGLYADFIEH